MRFPINVTRLSTIKVWCTKHTIPRSRSRGACAAFHAGALWASGENGFHRLAEVSSLGAINEDQPVVIDAHYTAYSVHWLSFVHTTPLTSTKRCTTC